MIESYRLHRHWRQREQQRRRWRPNMVESYWLHRHWRRSQWQRRRRRRKFNKFVSSSSSTTKRTTKTPPRVQKWLNRIGFVVVDDGANYEEAAAGAMAAAVPDDAADRMCHVPCIGGRRLVMQSMWLPGRRGRWTTTSNAPKSMKSMKSMKIMKERYDCYEIGVWRSNMIVTL